MSNGTNTSVDQIFDALDLLAVEGSLGVVELARARGLPTSTAHRLLVTLHDAGFAQRDSTGSRYELGIRAHELVAALFRRHPLTVAALPIVRQLVTDLGHTAVLGTRVGWHQVRMVGFEGWHEVHGASRIGQAELLYESGGGRAILAYLPAAEIEAYVHWESQQRRRSATRTREIHTTLAGVRAGRYGSYPLGADGHGIEVALPIRAGDRAIAAISVCTPTAALQADGRPRRAELRRIARAINELESSLRQQPELSRDPFGHLDTDQLAAALTLPPT